MSGNPVFWLRSGLFVSGLSLGAAYGLQYFKNFEPCSLCLLERWLIMTLMFSFTAQLVLLKFRAGLAAFFKYFGTGVNLLGLSLSMWHLWVQSQASGQTEHLSCIAPFDVLFRNRGLWKAIQLVIGNPLDCSENTSLFLGIPLSVWSLLSFLSLLLVNVQALRKAKLT